MKRSSWSGWTPGSKQVPVFIRNPKVKKEQGRNEDFNFMQADPSRGKRAPENLRQRLTGTSWPGLQYLETPMVHQQQLFTCAHSSSTSHLPALPYLLIQQCQGRSHTSAINTAHMLYVFRNKY